jgi:hypothetical protein
MPWFVPVASLVGSTVVRRIVAGGVIYLVGTEVVGEVSDAADERITDLENQLKDAGGDIISDAATAVGGFTLDVVRGFGAAAVDGIDGAYDALREKLRGKEPDVIAALVIGFGVVFGVVYLYQSFKNVNDAFGQGGIQVN